MQEILLFECLELISLNVHAKTSKLLRMLFLVMRVLVVVVILKISLNGGFLVILKLGKINFVFVDVPYVIATMLVAKLGRSWSVLTVHSAALLIPTCNLNITRRGCHHSVITRLFSPLIERILL